MSKVRVGVIGATGYAGAEICRLIWGHPNAELTAVSSVSFEGQALSSVYPSYLNMTELLCTNQQEVLEKSEAVFAALPHGLSEDIAKACDGRNILFIDIGADFRLEDEDEYKEWYGGAYQNPALHEKAVYGLPELFREKIRGARVIANPGCYTTAVPLSLAPAIRAGFIEQQGIVADCKSGVTGAGRSPTQGNHFPELNENFYAYKAANHRHTPEIEQTLSKLFGSETRITFVPHLLPVNRGILATCYARLKPGVTKEQIDGAYREFYETETFVRLLPKGKTPTIRSVRYTNFCDVATVTDERTGTLIALSAIDNMVKGAAGQAVQNMNIALGLCETDGLLTVPPAI